MQQNLDSHQVKFQSTVCFVLGCPCSFSLLTSMHSSMYRSCTEQNSKYAIFWCCIKLFSLNHSWNLLSSLLHNDQNFPKGLKWYPDGPDISSLFYSTPCVVILPYVSCMPILSLIFHSLLLSSVCDSNMFFLWHVPMKITMLPMS